MEIPVVGVLVEGPAQNDTSDMSLACSTKARKKNKM